MIRWYHSCDGTCLPNTEYLRAGSQGSAFQMRSWQAHDRAHCNTSYMGIREAVIVAPATRWRLGGVCQCIHTSDTLIITVEADVTMVFGQCMLVSLVSIGCAVVYGQSQSLSAESASSTAACSHMQQQYQPKHVQRDCGSASTGVYPKFKNGSQTFLLSICHLQPHARPVLQSVPLS